MALLISLAAGVNPALAQTTNSTTPTAARPRRSPPPTRDPNTPGYVTARDLPDGAVPPSDADGNFIIGPTHSPAPEMAVQDGVPHGTVDPADPARLVVTTSHPASYTRRVAVYVPRQYVPGTAAPFLVGADGP